MSLKKTFDKSLIHPFCTVCGKGAVLSVNKPHSQKRTNRLVKANIQSVYSLPMCTRCQRTMKRQIAQSA